MPVIAKGRLTIDYAEEGAGELFCGACPHWSFRPIAGAGHMAPLTRPELVNPIVRQFLDAMPS